MELGTGIFLSSVLLGSIALFIATKDKWNWKKIALRTSITFIAIIGLSAGSIYLYTAHENWPHEEESLLGVSLGMEKAEVKFLKSEPTDVKDNVWEYAIYEKQKHIVGFQKERVSYSYFVYDSLYGDNFEVPSLQKIKFPSTQEEIYEHFGKPTKVTWSREQLSKLFLYPKFNVFFLLTKNELRIMGIYDPAAWEPAFSDIELLINHKMTKRQTASELLAELESQEEEKKLEGKSNPDKYDKFLNAPAEK